MFIHRICRSLPPIPRQWIYERDVISVRRTHGEIHYLGIEIKKETNLKLTDTMRNRSVVIRAAAALENVMDLENSKSSSEIIKTSQNNHRAHVLKFLFVCQADR